MFLFLIIRIIRFISYYFYIIIFLKNLYEVIDLIINIRFYLIGYK